MLRETVIKVVATREMDSKFHGCLGGLGGLSQIHVRPHDHLKDGDDAHNSHVT